MRRLVWLRCLRSRISPVRAGLAVILPLRRRRNVTAVIVILVALVTLVALVALVPLIALALAVVIVTVRIWRHAVIAARFTRRVSVLPRNQVVLSVEDLAVAVDPETFVNRFAAAHWRFAGLEIDRLASELAFGLR